MEKWESETAVNCVKALIHHSSGVTWCQVKETGGIFVVWKCHLRSDLLFSAEQEKTSVTSLHPPTPPPARFCDHISQTPAEFFLTLLGL